MTEDSCTKVSEESMAAATAARQRKKRKWDQPAESLISAGLPIPGVFPLGSINTLVGVTLPDLAQPSRALLTNPVPAACATVPQILQASAIQQNATAIVNKINQPKIQDELIAREIVINDAEPTVRYKLTKRQTQEEILKCTGAVVITRGKYRPPNGLPDSEKPLYLHISAGAHLKDTAERIKAVDHAAAMVEEILKQGHNSQPTSTPFLPVINPGGPVKQPLSTCLFLGFNPDPSLNIAARIRGPNDQYINHIMNETGATVLLRGRGSGNLEIPNGEELQLPLHLYLSSHNLKSLEDAKLLAENLLDTISLESGVSRLSSSKVYNAVPPPQQMLARVQSSVREDPGNTDKVAAPPSSTVPSAVVPTIYPQGTSSSPSGGVNSYVNSQSNMISYPQTPVGITSYSGYGGIYPQATPLQQVALALRQSTAPATPTPGPTTSAVSTLPKTNSSSPNAQTDKRPSQKRKFQELPVASKGASSIPQNSRQGSECLKPAASREDLGMRKLQDMPPPKKLIHSSLNGMPLPPRAIPPPPPKFMPLPPLMKVEAVKPVPEKTVANPISDTLMKLVEYGEDDDAEGINEESPTGKLMPPAAPKPFWALQVKGASSG